MFQVIARSCEKTHIKKDHGATHSSLTFEVMLAFRAYILGLKISYDFDNVLSNQIEFDSILKQFGEHSVLVSIISFTER